MDFQFSRISKLLRIELNHSFMYSILIIGLIFTGLAIITLVGEAIDGANVYVDLHSLFLSVTLIGGVIIGSSSFGELNKRHTRINYLNLPASPLEKVLTKAFTYIILFPIAMFIIFSLVRLIFAGIDATFLEVNMSQKFDLQFKYLVAVILFTTSLFFYGSVRFNTYAFPKTIVWAGAILAIVSAIAFLIGLIIFPELRNVIAGQEPQFMIHGDELEHHWLIRMFKNLYFLSPILFVALSVFCLKEKEG